MPTVYFVPGIAGSELRSTAQGSQLIWADVSVLASGGLSQLALETDGTTPLPPCGRPVVAGVPLPAYYASTIALLRQQLGASWAVVPFGYDWRQDLSRAAALLTASITQGITPDAPCVLVCHSAGGLVARVVWANLVTSGQTDLVKRIITLGTPHQGSYSAVELFSGLNSTLLDLSAIATLAEAIGALLDTPSRVCVASSPSQILAIVLSWPSFYQLLPFLGSPDQSTDPNRPSLFIASNWGPIAVSQAYLTTASTSWAMLMNSSASLPPRQSLTTISGSGLTTPDVLVYPSLLGRGASWSTTMDGDGAVTIEDALIPTSWRYVVPATHQDIPYQVAQSGLLAAEVLVDRTPPTPAPPVDAEAGTLIAVLGAPPIPNLAFRMPRPSNMSGGDC